MNCSKLALVTCFPPVLLLKSLAPRRTHTRRDRRTDSLACMVNHGVLRASLHASVSGVNTSKLECRCSDAFMLSIGAHVSLHKVDSIFNYLHSRICLGADALHCIHRQADYHNTPRLACPLRSLLSFTSHALTDTVSFLTSH